MDKRELLILLDDSEVRGAIGRMLQSVLAAEGKDAFLCAAKGAEEEGRAEDLPARLSEEETTLRWLTMDCEVLRGQVSDLQKKLVEQQVFVEEEAAEKKAALEKMTRLAGAYAGVQSDYAEIKRKYEQLQEEHGRILGQGLSAMWDAFQSYEELSAELRAALEEVSAESLEIFVCQMQKPEVLPILWQTVAERLENEDGENAARLWQMFLYGLELQNRLAGKRLYSLLETYEGEPYNAEEQEICGDTSGSTAAEVYLQGYYEVATDRVLKKSLVRLE